MTTPNPRTWTAGDLLDADTMNREVRDAINFILGRAGISVQLSGIDLRGAGDNNGVGIFILPGQQRTGIAVIDALSPLENQAIILYSNNGVLSYRTAIVGTDGIVNQIESLHSATAEANGGVLYTTDDRDANGAATSEQAVAVLARPSALEAVLKHGLNDAAPSWVATSAIMVPNVDVAIEQLRSRSDPDYEAFYTSNSNVSTGTREGGWWTYKTTGQVKNTGSARMFVSWTNTSSSTNAYRLIDQNNRRVDDLASRFPNGYSIPASGSSSQNRRIDVNTGDVIRLQVRTNTTLNLTAFEIGGRLRQTAGKWT